MVGGSVNVRGSGTDDLGPPLPPHADSMTVASSRSKREGWVGSVRMAISGVDSFCGREIIQYVKITPVN